MKRQSGFTLIELVMVIVILGILAAVAIPKFVNLKGDAQTAATQGIAGSLASASAVNYAARSSGNTTDTVAVLNCSSVAGALQGGLPSPYTVASAAVTAGSTVSCTLSNNATPTPTTATFTAIGIS